MAAAALIGTLLPLQVIERLTPSDLSQVVELIEDWSAAHGLVVVEKSGDDSNGMKWKAAPVTLSPSCIPRECYEFGVEIAPFFSLLFHRLAQHPTFLEDTLKSVIDADIFTKNLLEIYQTCKQEGFEQELCLGIYRSDYMIDISEKNGKLTSRLLQVEVNAVAAAFSHLGHLATELHRYLAANQSRIYSGICVTDIPANDCHKLIPNALSKAHNAFLEQRKETLNMDHIPLQTSQQDKQEARIVVFMVAQPGEKNRIDQRHIEFALFERFGISLVRTSLVEIYEKGSLGAHKHLLLEHKGEILIGSVVYFRAGYTPDDFPTQKEWKARLLIERSSAIKGPNISYHLCGTKRVQQVLGEKSVLESFFPNEPHMVEQVFKSFAGMYDLDRKGSFVDMHKKAIAHPEDFVMKPQREGGGSLITGQDIVTALETWSDAALNSHILMERIKPVALPNFLVVGGKLSGKINVIPELGIYHSFLASSRTDEILLNETNGYLVRTKPEDVNDGGVAAGRAALDSICLCDLSKCPC